jgi:hypothetical protein
MIEKTSATLTGIVQEIITPSSPGASEKAEIVVQGAYQPHKKIRIDNTLTSEDGVKLRLKPGAHVEITIETKA